MEECTKKLSLAFPEDLTFGDAKKYFQFQKLCKILGYDLLIRNNRANMKRQTEILKINQFIEYSKERGINLQDEINKVKIF